MIARLVSNLLESVWTMVGRLLVCWRRMRQAMDRGRGRNIISVKMSEITEFWHNEFTFFLHRKH